ncbi:MAG: preprotein translocase subunit SecE [Alphaproteobacteria bacterium]|nr:preprotein translocase subunit SecE [Alphaproteobacteria bacterium]MBV9692864.1 preprotein translocase subunit SecE [Alphaproteobacteria bacterium]
MVDTTKKAMDAASAGKELPAPAARPRRGLFQFLREVRREGIDKVTWPTFKETRLTTMMVFIMVALTMAFFFIVDWLLAFGERLLIGAAS